MGAVLGDYTFLSTMEARFPRLWRSVGKGRLVAEQAALDFQNLSSYPARI